MADPATIMSRVRAKGANIVIRNGELAVLNARKLPAGSTDFIAENRSALLAYLADEQVEFDERAAAIEFEGRTPREWAEQFAEILIRTRPAGVSDLDWSWFVTRCGQIIDEAPERKAA